LSYAICHDANLPRIPSELHVVADIKARAVVRTMGSDFKAIATVDYTHVGRRASGIERITVEQFNNVALSPLEIRTYRASEQRLRIMFAQMLGLPFHAMTCPSDIYIFPGFPPSPYFAFKRDRSVLFVHDLFLLTRRADLNQIGKYYMAPLFHNAVRNFRHFLTNSESTAEELKAYCDPTATIVPYRPHIRNVFGLNSDGRNERDPNPPRVRIVTIGTIEPRKNFPAAIKIRAALSERLGREVELHIIGRVGWGVDVNSLRQPHVILHGYLEDERVGQIIEASDLLLCTSHAEGLCLPLIEAQYAGLPVAAPNERVFREVLGSSGILFNSDSPESAANQIADAITMPHWRSHYATASEANIVRWNDVAEFDRRTVVSYLSRLASGHQHHA
jgi:glycosyltransferase involved in cell wall biosynthesis